MVDKLKIVHTVETSSSKYFKIFAIFNNIIALSKAEVLSGRALGVLSAYSLRIYSIWLKTLNASVEIIVEVAAWISSSG